ncbi:ABC transporter ATP-binding protein [Actinoplanes sp. N902-109]|uniref:ABC transporter ATP-binding protein n=1 Tax=Actinoplanes sp. (strain N902-109) TaxID=649831 RepID=UPI0003294080|nr:ABC transporter ATP-binding protein [Actinoplanes sp. N902-109]AGL19133.1 ABC transporter related protein [Actinoplanes sp. N902-109]
MGDEPAIRTEALVKRYGRGGTTALKGLDLTVGRGEVFGFLGPNGAGKSTTIRILLDLLRPTSGSVRVLGCDPRSGPGVRTRIGYLAGDFVADRRQTGRELLGYLADLRGGVPVQRIHQLAAAWDVDLDKRIGSLSKGNRQKLGVIQAFMHRPPLLVLDEPTSGLDPFLQQQFVALVQEAAGNGQTVFMSSHVMSEVQQTCDRVGIIRAGTLVAVEHIEDLRRRALRTIEVHFAGAAPALSVPGVSEVSVDGTVLRCKLSGDADALVKELARHHVVDLISEEPELEDLFFSYYQHPGA